MQKILVIGCPGSGKSTFSRNLSTKLSLPLFHMDQLFWKSDKTSLTTPELVDKLDNIMQTARWIIDGNYLNTLEHRIPFCDTVFFLDYPLKTGLDGIKSRSGKPRPDLLWIESQQDTIEMLSYVHHYFQNDLPVVRNILDRSTNTTKHVFHSRQEAHYFLDQL